MILLYLLFLCVVTWEGACREESLEKPVSVQNLRGISGDKAKSERSMDESISRRLKKFNAYKAYDDLPAGTSTIAADTQSLRRSLIFLFRSRDRQVRVVRKPPSSPTPNTNSLETCKTCSVLLTKSIFFSPEFIRYIRGYHLKCFSSYIILSPTPLFKVAFK